MGKGTNLAIENQILAICLIVIWSFCLLLTFINAYLYFYMLKKYKVISLLIMFVGTAALCSIVIVFNLQCLNADSEIESNVSVWLFFMINMKLACLFIVIGFGGLIIDLILMMSLMLESSRLLKAAKRRQQL